MSYTIWSKPYHNTTWVFCGLQLDSEKLAEQTFAMYPLAPGETLNEAVTAPLVEAGFQAATLTFAGAALAPFSFVMPGPPDGPAHVAYFTAAVSPAGETRIEQANAEAASLRRSQGMQRQFLSRLLGLF